MLITEKSQCPCGQASGVDYSEAFGGESERGGPYAAAVLQDLFLACGHRAFVAAGLEWACANRPGTSPANEVT